MCIVVPETSYDSCNMISFVVWMITIFLHCRHFISEESHALKTVIFAKYKNNKYFEDFHNLTNKLRSINQI